MATEYNGDGFRLKVCKGELRIVEKPGSKFNEKAMVVIPFSLYNIRATIRNFPNNGYKYIVRGKEVKSGAKADYGFCDSLLNLSAKPKKEIFGYIRIPFEGPGEYGVKIVAGHGKKGYIGKFFDAPNEDMLEYNRELYMKFEKERFFPDKIKRLSEGARKKNTSDHNTITKTSRLDEYDAEIARDYGRQCEFGHGRKKSEEYTDQDARNLDSWLRSLRKKRENDPYYFDRDNNK